MLGRGVEIIIIPVLFSMSSTLGIATSRHQVRNEVAIVGIYECFIILNIIHYI